MVLIVKSLPLTQEILPKPNPGKREIQKLRRLAGRDFFITLRGFQAELVLSQTCHNGHRSLQVHLKRTRTPQPINHHPHLPIKLLPLESRMDQRETKFLHHHDHNQEGKLKYFLHNQRM
jgi:hypothetical protein